MFTAELVNLAQLEAQAGTSSTKAGHTYYKQGRAQVISVHEHQAVVLVRGTEPQPYQVDFFIQPQWLFVRCSCPYAARTRVCKHAIAAALQLHKHLQNHPPNIWRGILDSRPAPARRRSGQQRLLISLIRRGPSWALTPYLLPAGALADVPADKPKALHKALQTTAIVSQAKIPRSPIQPQHISNPDGLLALANMILQFNQVYYSATTIQPPAMLNTLLALAGEEPIYSGSDAKPFQQLLQTTAERGVIGLYGTATDQGLDLTPTVRFGATTIALNDPELAIVLPEHGWALYRNLLFQYADAGNLLPAFGRHKQIHIPPEDQLEFMEQYAAQLADQVPLSGDLPQVSTVQAEPQARLYLREEAGVLCAELRFGYAEAELAYAAGYPETSSVYQAEPPALLRIVRQPAAEELAWRTVLQHTLKRGPQPGVAVLRSGTTVATFLLTQVPKLIAAGLTIYGEETLLTARVNRHPPSLTLRVRSGIDWFDLEAVVQFGDVAVSLPELRRAIRKYERYVKLADGSIGEIPEEWLERYRHLFALGELHDERLRLAPHHAALVEDMLQGSDEVDTEFKQRCARLHDSSGITPHAPPGEFVGVLRPYQQAGYDWLHFLHDYGFGGCLADDMGTGKTIQTLAFLYSLRTSGHTTASSLIVLPRSLIFNWQREIDRWTPTMRVLVHTDQSRTDNTAAFDSYDLVLTTYGTMLRDIHLFSAYTFHYVVLDEAQAIKNPATQTARAARALRSEHRLTLTGTPVENSTLELWSQFAFLNPGMLGSLEYFRSEFAIPIERTGDQAAAQLLRRMVSPFILRRTKEQVAPELPPRDERILYCTMEPAQHKLYQRYRNDYRARLLQLIDEQGLDDTRIQVLEGLLRLRQICNHPRLVESDFRGRAAKFEQLLEILTTLHAEGHKVLVFSQFVRMLKLLGEQLEQRKLAYMYLDGQTRKRAAAVDQFQADPQIPFFLISLKAGGVGLNLTAADYVIHIDPWWNPAVEQQASDRSHRIGQDRPVFIYKLIMRDSVEEKILLLQERKQALVKQLITTEQSIVKTLTREDIADLFS